MQRSAAWLQSLVDNLAVEAQIETRQLHLTRGLVDLAACAETALTLVQPMLERAGQQVQVDGDAPLAWGDPRRVEQVLVNLLMNASKYGGAGSTICIVLGRAGGWATATVQDHGPGIPSAEQGRIFKRYVRGEAADKTGKSGLGLGLHIVKNLVERQGGVVGLLSAPGHGAAFWFTLPLALDASAFQLSEEVHSARTATDEGDGRRRRRGLG
jgi:signal transduction histidine kinase